MGVWKKGRETCLPIAATPRRKVVRRGVWYEFGTDHTQQKTWQVEQHISESFAHFILIAKCPRLYRNHCLH